MARGSNITPPLPPQHSSLWPGLPFFASFAPIDMPPCSRFLLPAAQLTGRSYEATFALSVVPAVLGLAVVATALGGDARSPGHHAAHREPPLPPAAGRAAWEELRRADW
jgi:hypothetical protein